MRLAATILREIPQNLKMLTFMNILSGIVTALMLGIVSLVGKNAGSGSTSFRLVLLYVVTIMLFSASHKIILVTAAQDGERLIHTLRLRLFEAVRRTDLVTVENIGRAALQGVLVRDTQTLAQTLPLLAIGGQQAVMLVFLAIYLAWLSPMACAMAFGFGAIAMAVRLARRNTFVLLMRATAGAESTVFTGLTDLLRGFKEVRMSRPRADGLVEAMGQASAAAQRINVQTKTRWGRDFAQIEAMFYTVIGVMVFVVPLLSSGYHEVVMPATTAALFIVGPIGTISFVFPRVADAELALANIEAMEQRLLCHDSTPQREPDDNGGRAPLPERTPTTIALDGARFSYRNAVGEPVFAVGPLSAVFRAGEITFITGGNGSGKSTMLRLLTALMPLDSGALLVDGAPVEPERMQAYRDRISAIFSDYHLSRRLYGIPDPDPVKVLAILEQLEMEDKVMVCDGAFSTIDLSTGQRKRLAMVVARLADKPVIMLDEWAADQDPHFRHVFYEELLPELKAAGKIVICVTHDDRWFDVADHIYHMNEGRIEAIR
ncbi:cyclic peptide export ABC transporter [Telmatospirillum sp.]|uniref:cyclic peptide export ABC transporter n=1 Tax=Telmatospirillum sp. TaxID=2079197 RepID=UPI002841244A|nr:cyclic peptide export ABC transporter [Telmatospirillum sp.]MDR3436282.1 cyclic peptide export ABC transporter [Telmatospirillum sp.]